MGNYYKVASLAEAVLFDGTQSGAEAAVAAYPAISSIQTPSITYPELTGDVEVDVATTGITVDVDITKDDVYTPYEIVFTVTGPATASDDITITFFEEDPIVVAVTDEDDALTIAAAIAAATFPGFTAVDNEDGTVTVTQDLDDQGTAVLRILTTAGPKTAVKDQYLAIITEQAGNVEVETTDVIEKAMFEKYYIEIVT